jgi:hypothetical protein
MDVPSSIEQGVVVVRAEPTAPRFSPPMRRGFVITEINRPAGPVTWRTSNGIVRRRANGDALAFYGYDPPSGSGVLVLATVDTR